MMMAVSCSSPLQEQVELALQSACSNRVELEQVLRHYDGQPLKQEAARFLIANMPFHQSYRGWEMDSMKCLIQRYRHVKKMDESVQKRWKDFDIPHLGAMFLLDTRVGYCRENCDIASYVMRALGIPVTMDFYEMSPSYNSRHFWSALIDTTGLAVPFNYTEKEISRLPDISARKKGKVYRLCYGAQPEKLEGMYQDSSIPSFFRNRLLGDASEEYFPGSEVEIRLDACKNTSPSYLCVFTGRELKPVDLTSTKRGTAIFRGVEPGLIYFAACRKFLGTAAGVVVEGANRRDFVDRKVLCHVSDTPPPNQL